MGKWRVVPIMIVMVRTLFVNVSGRYGADAWVGALQVALMQMCATLAIAAKVRADRSFVRGRKDVNTSVCCRSPRLLICSPCTTSSLRLW